ncbi:hypothetical protein DL764_010585 [Monosporascus ibericus]|uniref:DUF7726 domain-containing protein n=1 Tax=Monosporascus ibericus TaxID=155417 RepID=A0A4Q4SU10_9PEZI|nr:hypothetical protein DL764_010585 [Monosporascus ibericus]
MQATSDTLTPGDQLAILSEVRPMLTTRVPGELILMIVENLKTEKDLLALAETCKLFYHAVLPLLLDKNARGQRTALHWACVNGHVETVKRMLEAGAHISPFNLWVKIRKFSTPIAYLPRDKVQTCSRKTLLPDVHELGVLDSYSSAIQNLRGPLHIAAAWRHVEVVRILVAEGTDPLYRTKPRRSSRKNQSRYSKFDAIDWAITRSPFVPHEELPKEATKVTEIIRILLKHLPVVRNEYLTHVCCQWMGYKGGRYEAEEAYMSEIIRTLLSLSASPNYIPSRPAYLELLGLLLNGDVDINAVVAPGSTLLQLTSKDGNAGLVRFLLERGADVNLPDGTDSSPLHLLVRHHGFLRPFHFLGMGTRIVEMLLEHGANPENRDRFGFRPFDIAIFDGMWDIAGLLMMVEQSQRKPLEDASNRANVAAGSEARDAPPREPSFEEYLDDAGATLSMSKPRWDKFKERALKYAKAKEDEGQLGDFSAYKDPDKPGGFSTRKRKSETSLEDDMAAYKQNLDHIFVEDMPVDSTCNQVRDKINRLIDSGIMKKGEFCTATGLSNQNLNSFLSKKGTYGGSGCAAYRCAWQWFKQRDIAGLKMPDVKKRQKREADGLVSTTSSGARAGARSNPGVVSRPDISDVYLPGEETDSVPVWDTCDEIRRKISAHLKDPRLTQAQFCRDLYAQLKAPKCKGIKTTQLAGFRSQKGPKAGCKSTVFYAAYVYFEKLRLVESKPKSDHRLDMEEVWGRRGGFDTEHHERTRVVVHADSHPYMDKYGRILTERFRGY